jgi:hypothetical protein
MFVVEQPLANSMVPVGKGQPLQKVREKKFYVDGRRAEISCRTQINVATFCFYVHRGGSKRNRAHKQKAYYI